MNIYVDNSNHNTKEYIRLYNTCSIIILYIVFLIILTVGNMIVQIRTGSNLHTVYSKFLFEGHLRNAETSLNRTPLLCPIKSPSH